MKQQTHQMIEIKYWPKAQHNKNDTLQMILKNHPELFRNNLMQKIDLQAHDAK